MKPKNHQSIRLSLVPMAAIASLGLAASSHAALTVGASAPTGNVIATSTTVTAPNVGMAGIGSNYVAGDNGSGLNLHMLGQSFTTGTLGSNSVLETIAVQSTGGANFGGSLTLNLFEVTQGHGSLPNLYMGAGTLLQSWTASSGLPASNGPSGNQWVTFNMSASNFTLANNKTYAFTFSNAGTGGDTSKIYFEWNGTSTNPYSGGQAMSQDVADQPSGALYFGQPYPTTAGDRVFQVTTIPEPSAAALLGGFGMLALLRRRR